MILIIIYSQKNNTYHLSIKIMKFALNDSLGYKKVKKTLFLVGRRRIVSCYFTVTNKYICFYQSEKYELTSLIYPNTSLSTYTSNVIYNTSNVVMFLKIIWKNF